MDHSGNAAAYHRCGKSFRLPGPPLCPQGHRRAAGFDESAWAVNSNAASRSWDDLEEEFRALRKSTELLFGSLNDEQLKFTGTASGSPINALALGFIIPGHVIHHMRIIKERYL